MSVCVRVGWCFRTSYISSAHTESGGTEEGRKKANGVLLQLRIMIVICSRVGFQPLFFLFPLLRYASICHAYLRPARGPRGTRAGSRRHTEDARLETHGFDSGPICAGGRQNAGGRGLHGPLCNIKPQPHTMGLDERRRERRAAQHHHRRATACMESWAKLASNKQAMLVVA